MSANHSNKTYKTTDIPNPFKTGQDTAYADILLHNINELKWWRQVVGIGSLVLFFISFLFAVYAVRLQKTVPVLVNVMPSGEASYLGEVRSQAALAVPEAAILFQVRKFITDFRSISTDSEVLYNNIDDCYQMITSKYEPVMTRFLQANSPFKLVGKIRRTVEIESAIKITGSSYQIDWIETVIDSQGQKKKKLRAIVTAQILPTDEKTIKRNPLGIYIDNCEMTEL
jgi:type IV secretion system protein VirB5